MMNDTPMPRGLPLGLALRRWTHPCAIAKLDRLEEQASERPQDLQLKAEAMELRAKLESDFIANLFDRHKQLWASVFVAPVVPNSQRGELSRDVIRDMDSWNFDTSEAWFKAADDSEQDMHLVRIEILGPIPQWEVQRWRGAASTPLERTETLPLHLSRDNATLTVSGESLIFRGRKHQHILRQLFEAYKSGDKLRTINVLEKAQVKADSLRKAFNKSPNWRTLERIIQQEQGYCWFDVR
jgi:hypothetical protein